jgi:tetratricopeptide (TPR) repeat protein
MTGRTTTLGCAALLTAAVGLAAWLEPRSEAWRGQRARADSLLWTLLGDGRRLFANHFFVKADVYLHSGYYPSIFDQARAACEHGVGEELSMAGYDSPGEAAETHVGCSGEHGCEGHLHDHGSEHEFRGAPRDWIDRLSRHFQVREHTHLEGGQTEAEILPWLRLAAEFDPHQEQFYVAAAYWLRSRLGKVDQAEAFLRRGLRANPDSDEILFELGRLAWESRREADRARHLWNAAERAWYARNGAVHETNRVSLSRILAHRAQLEEQTGNLDAAIQFWTRVRELSPRPEAIEQRLATLRQRLPVAH